MTDGRELTCSQASDEEQPLLQQPPPVQSKRCCHRPHIRKVKSKGAVVVLVWLYCLIFSVPGYSLSTEITVQGVHVPFFGFIAAIVVCLSGPLAGLIAGLYCGRYGIVSWSIWIAWIGDIAIVSVLILQGLYPTLQNVFVLSGLALAEAVHFFGVAVFLVNCVPFGLDQMPDASGEEIKAFIHWLVWTIIAGVASVSLLSLLQCSFLRSPDSTVVMTFVSAVPLSTVLCIHCVLHKYFIIEPVGSNPLRSILKVLKFAAKHKKPIRRSAFTYCEDEQPSRIDLGKSKYGGPFTNEEVEDVKTFLRMLLVISLSMLIVAPLFTVIGSLNDVLHNEFDNTGDFMHLHVIISGVSSTLSIALSPVVHDFVILPVVRRCSLSSLRVVGFTQILSIIVCLIMLVSSTIWYLQNMSSQLECVVTAANENSHLPFSHIWINVPVLTFFTTVMFFVLKNMLEFVCAQAPYRLQRLLVGLSLSALIFGASVGGSITVIWKAVYKAEDEGGSSASCGVWFYVFCTTATILGLVVWIAVAKWYKKRERDEPETYRIFIENYYDH